MKKFNEFNIIPPPKKSFIGDKLKIDRILKKEIVVLDYKIEKSKFEKGSGKCLYLQIEYNTTKYVVFSGSTNLMETIEQIPREQLPILATIEKDQESGVYSFN